MNVRGLISKKYRSVAVLLCFVGSVTVLIVKPGVVPSRLCTVCHMMKPEYYTWQASSHGRARVNCMACHSPPGIKGFGRAGLKGFKALYSAAGSTYVAPIKMKDVVADGACERCHSRESLNSAGGGDIKISHSLHATIRVNCVKCHTGLAHGQIANRGVTYASDYQRWEKAQGAGLMADKAYSQPDMDVCFRCHKLRSAPITCESCHQKSRMPAGHKKPGFKEGGHGRLPGLDIKSCDNCHRFMTDNKIEKLEEGRKFEEYLSQGKPRTGITPAYYSRVNEFCKDCHSKKPVSHDREYISNHRTLAEKSTTGCLTCHNNQKHRADPLVLGSVKSLTQVLTGQTSSQTAVSQSDDTPPSSVNCATCHPSSHSESGKWKTGLHPVPLPANPKITRYCFYCHREAGCTACHGKVQSIKIQKGE